MEFTEGSNKERKLEQLRNAVSSLQKQLRHRDRAFWDLISLLRASGALPKVKDQGISSTAEASVCGCPVAWMGDPEFGGSGRVVYHREGCPLKPTIGASDGQG